MKLFSEGIPQVQNHHDEEESRGKSGEYNRSGGEARKDVAGRPNRLREPGFGLTGSADERQHVVVKHL